MQISSTERNESFVTTIDYLSTKHTAHVAEAEWVHFLQDHFEQLRANSTYVTLNEQTMYRYRYRICDFLESVPVSRGCDQAFRIVNRLHNDLDFNLSLEGVYIPDERFISELRVRYVTSKAIYASLN